MDEIILKYFIEGFTYLEIIELLEQCHNYSLSLSSLKRYFKINSISRRPLPHLTCSLQEVSDAIQIEINGSGGQLGYRRMHKSLLDQGLLCRRSDVRMIMKAIDPESVTLRRKRRLRRRKYQNPGPNHTWHLDGHDKLKPFGFSIHGCIDGFSRKLLWLEVAPSNKQPEVIAKYYLKAIEQFGLPKTIKADDGTEHSIIEPIHLTLRSLDGEDAIGSFSITTSPQNQRIESYWSILQRDRIGWWRTFFNELSDLGMFTNNDPVVVDCIRYCFMHLIRQDLNSVLSDWNSHIISGSSRSVGPTGRPDTMCYLPMHFGGEKFDRPTCEDDLADFNQFSSFEISDYSQEFDEFVNIAIGSHSKPTNPNNALLLYTQLIEKINDYS